LLTQHSALGVPTSSAVIGDMELENFKAHIFFFEVSACVKGGLRLNRPIGEAFHARTMP
jgi:hypothetical protein